MNDRSTTRDDDYRTSRADGKRASPTERGRWTEPRWRSRLDLLFLAVVIASFWWAAGLPGLGAGVTLALAWAVLPNVAVFVAGWVAIGAVVPPEASLAVTAAPALALGTLLLTTWLTARRVRDALAVAFVWGLLSAVVAGAVVLTEQVWLAGLVTLVAAALGFVSVDLIALSRFTRGSHE